MANIYSDFSDVTDGKSFFRKFCSAKYVAPSNNSSPSITDTPTGSVGYSEPLVSSPGLAIFHLKGLLDDTIVFAITTFSIADTKVFQKQVRYIKKHSRVLENIA